MPKPKFHQKCQRTRNFGHRQNRKKVEAPSNESKSEIRQHQMYCVLPAVILKHFLVHFSELRARVDQLLQVICSGGL